LSIKHYGWQFLLTLGECWFYFAPDHEHTWLRPEEQSPENAAHMIQDPRMMVTIAGNPVGFHLPDSLPKSRTFNAQYHLDHVLSALLSLHPQADGRKLMIHADNASPYTSRKCTNFLPYECPSTRRTPTVFA
jgi:hypothetical protein